jgi:hypothetical protein
MKYSEVRKLVRKIQGLKRVIRDIDSECERGDLDYCKVSVPLGFVREALGKYRYSLAKELSNDERVVKALGIEVDDAEDVHVLPSFSTTSSVPCSVTVASPQGCVAKPLTRPKPPRLD